MAAIVEAVPMGAQCPTDRDMAASASINSSWESLPSLKSSAKRQMSEVPIFFPLYLPTSMGPPERTRVGRLTEAAPITRDGVVLSQPHIRMTPSMGLARMLSSTSMETRFRKSMAVGLMEHSPRDMTGNSRGNPPASQTPRLIASAKSRKWALQGVSSDQVLQMPITGFSPSKRWWGSPWFFIQDR